MSTRGLYGFRYNKQDKTSYNHSDSYPSWLGKSIVEFCQKHTIADMKTFFNGIKMIDEQEKPSREDVENLKNADIPEYAMADFIQGDDWYKALRGVQGDLDELYGMYEKLGFTYMTDSKDFIMDSLFCEYGYIINLDTEMIEFWKGFQRHPDPHNRYGTGKEDGYYPCRMLAMYPLHNLFGTDGRTVEDIVKNMEMVSRVDYEVFSESSEQEESGSNHDERLEVLFKSLT